MSGAQSDEERATMRELPYLQLIGSLLYIGVMSRPDISYALSVLCRFMSDPSMENYEAAQYLLLYLAGSADQCMSFTPGYIQPKWFSKNESKFDDGNENGGFHAYSDSSWGSAEPRYGYVIYFTNGPIAYCSKALKSAGSSCEAEYAAACYCGHEVYFNRGCLEDLGIDIQGAVLSLTDNTAAIDTVHNLGATSGTKHYERAVHWIRSHQQEGHVNIRHCDTEFMHADIFTKPLLHRVASVLTRFPKKRRKKRRRRGRRRRSRQRLQRSNTL